MPTLDTVRKGLVTPSVAKGRLGVGGGGGAALPMGQTAATNTTEIGLSTCSATKLLVTESVEAVTVDYYIRDFYEGRPMRMCILDEAMTQYLAVSDYYDPPGTTGFQWASWPLLESIVLEADTEYWLGWELQTASHNSPALPAGSAVFERCAAPAGGVITVADSSGDYVEPLLRGAFNTNYNGVMPIVVNRGME